MTIEELEQNKELLTECGKEVELKVRAGADPEQAKLEVFKAHGVEIDEDAAKAAAVGKMELSDDELDKVAGGANWCWHDHACVTVYKHDDEAVHGDVCAWDYECFAIAKCDISATSGLS